MSDIDYLTTKDLNQEQVEMAYAIPVEISMWGVRKIKSKEEKEEEKPNDGETHNNH